MSTSVSSTVSATASASTSAVASTVTVSSNLKVVGIILAVASGVLIGSSFVFKKKGLIRSQTGGELGEGVGYLKSPLWWTGMIMMILGELCNFAAYAFVEALVVTPMGALSVVICAILSSLFLNEKLSFFGWLGCALCLIGSTIIALNGPQEASVGQITEFQKLFLAPGFLVYIGVLISASLVIIFYFAPKHGKKSMLWYIGVCSMIGGISVSVTTGLGAAIVTTAMGDNQFKHWFIYFLFVFVAVTLITEVYYLNRALALFNTAMVTPTYYVIFSFCSMVTTVVLFQGLKASATQIITIVLAFSVICCGITILQMSKIDPRELGNKLDRRSTLLLQAARSNTARYEEKDLAAIEDPGIDAIRGSMGVFGSIIRERSARRLSQSSKGTGNFSNGSYGLPSNPRPQNRDPYSGMQRHQLYDAPVPSFSGDGISDRASVATSAPRTPTIKFGTEEVVHKYRPTGAGDASATHERRDVINRTASPNPLGLQPIAEASVDGLPLHQPSPQPAFATSPAAELSSSRFLSPSPKSAPATLFPPGNPGIGNVQLVDPFEKLPATAGASTFGSVGKFGDRNRLSSTQPLPQRSRFSDMDEDDEGWRRDSQSHRVQAPRHSRVASDRRGYPRNEDDREESISLVQDASLRDDVGDDNEYDNVDDDDIREGGIRLVGQSSDGRRF
ncbi:DUF803-domain-containing protein [Schizopora paradoxa]|uniref:DUF803-domain-containing protein n=1 Tax=Schizopora paradoxa TaxID=27342 RepID=A0A0H2RUV3_9AGAM|nr:DUF803-domain-containing protein [Schizopora paradoxa]